MINNNLELDDIASMKDWKIVCLYQVPYAISSYYLPGSVTELPGRAGLSRWLVSVGSPRRAGHPSKVG
jgi:hypothetical protein